MKIKKVLYPALLFFMILGSFSCIERETPRPMPHIPGDVTRDEIFIESDYKYQVFYNLETGVEVSQNLKTAWDFAISTKDNHVMLNTSTFATAAKTQTMKMSEVLSSSGQTFISDHHSGKLDSLSIGDWDNDIVYVIDRGYDWEGKKQGFGKVKWYKEHDKLILEYAKLTDVSSNKVEIMADKNYDYTYFSFDDGEVKIAPESDNWHLCFTQYTHLFDEDTPYLVTGVLLNNQSTVAQAIKDSTFESVDISSVSQIEFSNSRSIIGYDWKTYDYNAGSFIVHSENAFMVKTANEYYKLHFLDFYNETGSKGNFHIEYQKL